MIILFLIPDLIITTLCLFFTKDNWLLCSSNIFSILKKNKKIMGYIIPGGLVGITVICYSRLDLILALPLLGQKAQAIYSYAFRFVEPFAILTSLLTISFITEIGVKNKEKFINSYIRILNTTRSIKKILVVFILSLIISSLLVLFTDLVLHFHYKMLIFILGMPILLRFVNNIMFSFFFRTSQYLDLLKIVFLNSIIILVSGVVLVSYFDLIGIAVASAIGEIYLFIIQRNYISKKLILK